MVGGNVDGRPYYACYQLSADSMVTGVGLVIEGDGTPTEGPLVAKQGGAWPQIGEVTSPGGFVIGGAGLLGFCWFYYRR